VRTVLNGLELNPDDVHEVCFRRSAPSPDRTGGQWGRRFKSCRPDGEKRRSEHLRFFFRSFPPPPSRTQPTPCVRDVDREVHPPSTWRRDPARPGQAGLTSVREALRRAPVCRRRCRGRPFVEHRTPTAHECDERCAPHLCQPLPASSIRRCQAVLSSACEAAVGRTGSGQPDGHGAEAANSDAEPRSAEAGVGGTHRGRRVGRRR
jgi:hypothetical protein